ncbi:NAD(P)-binding protein [Pseudohyphozyma bogoriensis]|nr:NAD(P)-binding protein [Pseudohyphozyma bogoriensis]
MSDTKYEGKAFFLTGAGSGNVQSVLKDAHEALGPLYGVFNCAGINPTRIPLVDTTDEYFDKLVNCNLKGVYNVTKAAIPYLAPDARFVNVSSISGLRAGAETAIYNATKFGVIGFSKAMALELGPKGIRTNIICPGSIETPSNLSVMEGAESVKASAGKCALERNGQPNEIADVVAFLFSDDARYMNGSVVEVSGMMK